VREIRDNLLGAYPRMEPHARLWFVRLPNNVGFLAGNGPVVRVWYQDSTLEAGYYSAYTARAPDEPAGPDHFFRMDEAGQFMEIRRSAADDTSSTAALADEHANPRFRTDRLSLATALAQGQDWRGCRGRVPRARDRVPRQLGVRVRRRDRVHAGGRLDGGHAMVS
jgi:hypothetical protein